MRNSISLVSVIILLCTISLYARPENSGGGRNPLDQGGDNCSDAFDLSGMSLPITTTGTLSGYSNDFGTSGLGVTRPTGWYGPYVNADMFSLSDVAYAYEIPVTGYYDISLCNSSHSVGLLVYQNTCPTSPVNPVDFLCGGVNQCGNLFAGAVFSPMLNATQQILIVVEASTNNQNYELNIDQLPGEPIPGNAVWLHPDYGTRWVSAPNNANLNITSAITVEAWVRIDDDLGQRVLIGKGVSISTPYRLRINSNRTLQMLHRSGGQTYFTSSPAIHALALRTWAHIAVVISPENNGSHKYYINGDSVYAQTNIGFGALFVNSDSLYIGGSANTNDQISGAIDEVRIWNRERSPEEIQTYASSTLDVPVANLVGYWRMDETSGTTLADASGNGITCRLRGGAQLTPSRARIFDVPQGVISLGAPNGIETWFADSTVNIEWASLEVDAVDIELNRDYPSGAWETIATDVPAAGSYSWLVSGDHTLTARIRVLDAANPSIGDTSDANFFIVSADSLPEVAGYISPIENEINVSLSPTFVWGNAEQATSFELYVWPTSEPEPNTPTVTTTTQTSASLNELLEYGADYNWRVITRNGYGLTSGPIRQFATITLPDLVLTDIQIPVDAYAGQSIDVSWIVNNQGSSGTSVPVWHDKIYISTLSTFDPDFATQLASVENVSYLNGGESYANTGTITIPSLILGEYYLYVRADANSQQVETDDDNNLARSTTFLTVQAPPVPDLDVTNVITPSIVIGGDNNHIITYTVTNVGDIPAEANGGWTDAVFFSADSFLDAGDELLDMELAQEGLQLDANESYEETFSVEIPRWAYGYYYFIVVSDISDEVFEFTGEYNNVQYSDSVEVILLPPPDLVVRDMSMQLTASSGQDFEISWKDSNAGPGSTYDYYIDKVYISSLPDFDIEEATELGRTPSFQRIINPEEVESQAETVKIPNGYLGDYYIYIACDATDDVFEYVDGETNNVARFGAPITVILTPWPDLIVQTIAPPATVTAGSNASFQVTVKNDGPGPSVDGTWTDRIYLSESDTWNPEQATLVATRTQSGNLISQETQVNTVNFMVSPFLSGPHYLYYISDETDQIYEYEYEDNNIARSDVFDIIAYPPVDLRIASVTTPSNGSSGQPVIFDWTVENIGGASTIENSWSDAVYLSTDLILEPESDILLGSRTRSGSLGSSQSYSRHESYTIPDGLSGVYYVIAVTDQNSVVTDINVTNNWAVAANQISINLSPSPDLVLGNFSMSGPVIAGQPLPCSWTVTNTGNGATDGQWYTAFSLSQNLQGAGTISLGSKSYHPVVDPAGVVNESEDIEIPSYVSGAWYLNITVDSRDDQYEHNGEDNNVFRQQINVVVPPPSDLIVTNIQIPSSGSPGDNVTVNYVIENVGEFAATGWMRDGVYFSLDETWDINDGLLGLNDQYIDIPAGASQTMSQTVSLSRTIDRRQESSLDEPLQTDLVGALPGLLPSSYYAIVRTDLRNNLRESNDANNLSASAAQIDITVPEWILGDTMTVGISEGEQKYYRIQLATEEDLVLKMIGDDFTVWGELYVSHESVPTASTFDFGAYAPFQETQTLLYPEAQAGVHYVMVRSQEGGPFQLVANALQFELTDVSPTVVGNGRVTTTLTGAKFRNDSQVFLRLAPDNLYPASRIEFLSSMEMKVRWELADVPLGTYDIVVQNDTEEAVLEDGLTVVVAMPADIGVSYFGPTTLRQNASATVQLLFDNRSNIDIPYSEITLFTGQDAQIENFDISSNVYDIARLISPLDRSGITYEFSLYSSELDDSMSIYTFTTVDLAPGEAASLSVNISSFADSRWSFDVSALPLSSSQYIMNVHDKMEDLRLAIINAPDLFEPSLASLAEDEVAFRDSVFSILMRAGEIDSLDFAQALWSQSISNVHEERETILEEYTVDMTCGKLVAAGDDSTLLRECINWGACACQATFDTRCLKVKWITLGAGATLTIIAALMAKAPPLLIAGGVITMTLLEVEGWICDHFKPLVCSKFSQRIKNECLELVQPVDPNEILGPEGFGDESWTKNSAPHAYTVYFENDPEMATAPAQLIRITSTLDSTLNPASFRLGSFGFGPFVFPVPDNRAYYSTRLDVRDSLGVYVDVTAGINVTTKQAFWVLESIDPATGEPPVNPLVGLLPVNDSLGRGEGFVTYTVTPKSNAQTGYLAQAQAEIVFDQNEPIETNLWANTLDAGAPTSVLDTAVTFVDSTTVTLHWSGEDDSLGCGVQSYDLYYSSNGRPYTLLAGQILDTFVTVGPLTLNSYDFFVRAVDNVGNEEEMKNSSEVSLFFLGGDSITFVDSLTILIMSEGEGRSARLDWLPEVPDTSFGENAVSEYWIYSQYTPDASDYAWHYVGSTLDTTFTYSIPADTTGNYRRFIVASHSLPASNVMRFRSTAAPRVLFVRPEQNSFDPMAPYHGMKTDAQTEAEELLDVKSEVQNEIRKELEGRSKKH